MNFFVHVTCGDHEIVVSGWYNSLDLGRIIGDHIARHLAAHPLVARQCVIRTQVVQLEEAAVKP